MMAKILWRLIIAITNSNYCKAKAGQNTSSLLTLSIERYERNMAMVVAACQKHQNTQPEQLIVCY